jgi:hypothetical protein
MFRAGNITSKRATPRGNRATAPGTAPVMTRPSAKLPSLANRNPRHSQVRHCATDHHSNHGADETKVPERLPLQYATAPLIQARPALTTSPLAPQTPQKPRAEPFNPSIRALFEQTYDKLPLDHGQYSIVLEVPNNYAVLSKGEIVLLAVHHQMFDSTVLTFPLNPKDASKILGSEKERESYVQDLRKNMSSRYIFSLEGVHRMRCTLDPDYQPL